MRAAPRVADPDVEVRRSALGALSGLASPEDSVLDALVATLLEPGEAEVRADAARALGALGAEKATVIEALVETLGDGDPLVRRQAVRALGRIGPASYPAVDQLRAIVDDPAVGDELRMHARYALRSIGAAVPDEPAPPAEEHGGRADAG